MSRPAIILAGGRGTRLQSTVKDLPKPMAPVAGRPFLEYLLDALCRDGFREVIMTVGYRHEIIINHFRSKYKDIKITYAIEFKPLGTGGAIRFAFEHTKSKSAMILNGDSYLDANFSTLENRHISSNSACSLVLTELATPDRYGTVMLDNHHNIKQFREKEAGLKIGYVNTGIYFMDRESLNKWKPGSNFSIEKEYFEFEAMSGRLFGIVHQGFFIDIGVPEDYERAQTELPRNIQP